MSYIFYYYVPISRVGHLEDHTLTGPADGHTCRSLIFFPFHLKNNASISLEEPNRGSPGLDIISAWDNKSKVSPYFCH